MKTTQPIVRLGTILLAGALATAAHAAPAVVLTEAAREYALGPSVEYLEDRDGTIAFDDIRAGTHDERFVRNTAPVMNFGFTKSAYWMRVTVKNNHPAIQNWLLEVGYPHHDYIRFYSPSPSGKYEMRTAGDRVAFNEREVRYHTFLFRLAIPRGSSMTVYLRFQTESSFQVPLTLWEPTAFAETVNRSQYGFGVYYGIMIVMLLYNLFLFIGIRERVYLIYILFIGAFILGQMSLNGFAFEYLWFAVPWWANVSVLFSLFLSIFFSILFCRDYLNTKANVPAIDKVLLVLLGCSVLGMGMSIFAPYALGVKFVALMATVLAIPSIAAGIICMRKGVPAAKYYLIAWLALLIGVMLLGLRNLGAVPTFFLTTYSIQIGSAMQVVLLSLGLADRINTMRRERYLAQQEALESHREMLAAQEKLVEQLKETDRIKDEMNRDLERKVEERTAELKSARDQLWGEMQLAKKIQTVLLPERPAIPGFQIAAHMQPADEVGGDYYDIINVEGLDWLVIGDVSGHGVPAGLIMMMVQTAIHTALAGKPNLKPQRLLSHINQVVTANIKKLNEDKYMTITVLACLKNGKFYFSGLHQDIMVYRAATKAVEIVETDGIWLGLVDDIKGMLHDSDLTLASGDVMLLYTDGITEAWRRGARKDERDPESDMFGDERLKSCLLALGEKEPEEIKRGILDEMRDYMPADDVTLLIVKKG
ncbi:MAG TPA: 7TM diverse intracellular signaling domain-containing protein [Spirochaetota bacterium]|nr:7TM diverse intracellular signaling domain-containing protein [Spirochaetota bacterium]